MRLMMWCHSTNILPHRNSAREGRTTKQFSTKRLETPTSMITEPLHTRSLAGEYASSRKPTSVRKKKAKMPNIPSKKTPSTFRSAGARTPRPGTWSTGKQLNYFGEQEWRGSTRRFIFRIFQMQQINTPRFHRRVIDTRCSAN